MVYLCKGRESSKSNGKDSIIRSFDKLVLKEKISRDQADRYLGKIVTGNIDLAVDADLLIEAVSESLEIKRSLFQKLDRICKSNTKRQILSTVWYSFAQREADIHSIFNP